MLYFDDIICPGFFVELGKTVTKSGVGMERIDENDDIDMTVELDLMDGKKVTCAIVTILTVNGKDYIVLLPLDDEGQSTEGEVWFYGYKEDESDPNIEPELIYIEDDDEYEAVADAFDEYLDNEEFEMMKED